MNVNLDFVLYFTYFAAAAFALLSSFSLLAKSEIYRGSGRIVLGLALLCVSLFVPNLCKLVYMEYQWYLMPSILFGFAGLANMVSGTRKLYIGMKEEPKS